MHLLLLQLAAFLIEQVGILIDKVQVVTRSDGHCVTTSLGQTVVRLFRADNNTLRTHKRTFLFPLKQSALKSLQQPSAANSQTSVPGEVSGVQTHSR